MTQRKRYDRQFKLAAARTVCEGEMTVIGLSKELGIKDTTLRRWAHEYEEDGDAAIPIARSNSRSRNIASTMRSKRPS